MKGYLLLTLCLISACTPKGRGPEQNPYALPDDGSSDAIVHVVKTGDTWSALAEDYFDDPDAAEKLLKANRDGGAELTPGRQILIPMRGSQREAFIKRADARAPYNKGLEMARRGEYPAAIGQFQQALRTDPDMFQAHYNLGLIYRRSGKLQLAQESLIRAQKLRRQHPGALLALGLTFRDLDANKKAERALRLAVRHAPDNINSLYALARLLDEVGRPAQAVPFWERFADLAPRGPRLEEAIHRLLVEP